MIESLAVVVVCVLFWVMKQTPFPDGTLEGFSIFADGGQTALAVLALVVDEAVELEAGDALESVCGVSCLAAG